MQGVPTLKATSPCPKRRTEFLGWRRAALLLDVGVDAQGRQKRPQSVGKYPILGLLGKGAMGIVYKSFDPDLRRRSR